MSFSVAVQQGWRKLSCLGSGLSQVDGCLRMSGSRWPHQCPAPNDLPVRGSRCQCSMKIYTHVWTLKRREDCCMLSALFYFFFCWRGGGTWHRNGCGLSVGAPTSQHPMMIIGNPMVLHFLSSNFKCNEILGPDAEGKVAVWAKVVVRARRWRTDLSINEGREEGEEEGEGFSPECQMSPLRLFWHPVKKFRRKTGPAHEICRWWLNLGYFH